MSEIRSSAYAKINLSLGITGKRKDGYHTIDTIMQSVSLCDTVTVKEHTDISVECAGLDVDAVNNTAYKAAKAFFEKTSINAGANVNIIKRIPPAAGLGGGSADAAAVLLSLDKLYGTALGMEKLCNLAVEIGADVPFFIEGGTKRARGIGELLTDTDPIGDCFIIIIKNGDKLSTADMYKMLDEARNPVMPDNDELERLLACGDLKKICGCFKNSFEVLWDNTRLKSELDQTNPLCVSLSGSGPSVFAVYEDCLIAKKTEEILKNNGYECYLTKPVRCGVKFE